MPSTALLWLGLVPSTATAFCGFYVSGADGQLFNDATQVVLMRDGTRTALSMQNHYDGPPEDFAMVVPVPVVLEEEHVKTLSAATFSKVDQMGAPRLVEYWEQDPCQPQVFYDGTLRMSSRAPRGVPKSSGARPEAVVVEAEFSVGEYDIVVLSAQEAGALDRWLRDHQYRIPDGAEALFKPYIAAGQYFFVAKVSLPKVTRDAQGRAVLSPLRFHYDSERFELPIRLGLINSRGPQDLLVHILAADRYEAANRPDVTIPTNLDLAPEAADRFGELYAALFDATLEANPGAVVTEYAWAARTCDPCPGPTLNQADLLTLGLDVMPNRAELEHRMVLTRLHARTSAQDTTEDLVFQRAKPLQGGREHWVDGRLESGAALASTNSFQGRYAIRHPWEGPIDCEEPMRGQWGGPPGGASPKPRAASDVAFTTAKSSALALVHTPVPELGLEGADTPPPGDAAERPPDPLPEPSGQCATGSAAHQSGLGLAWLGLIGLVRRRRS